MKTLRTLAMAAMLLAAASPALAAEQIFHETDGPEILSDFDGKPIWQLQAVCAGFHGATANYYARTREPAKASASEAAGLAALNQAVAKIRRDRGLDEAAATRVAEPIVTVGGRAIAEILREDGIPASGVAGRWNYWRSFCIDAKDTFNRVSN